MRFEIPIRTIDHFLRLINWIYNFIIDNDGTATPYLLTSIFQSASELYDLILQYSGEVDLVIAMKKIINPQKMVALKVIKGEK